jgi:hypothetical protein
MGTMALGDLTPVRSAELASLPLVELEFRESTEKRVEPTPGKTSHPVYELGRGIQAGRWSSEGATLKLYCLESEDGRCVEAQFAEVHASSNPSHPVEYQWIGPIYSFEVFRDFVKSQAPDEGRSREKYRLRVTGGSGKNDLLYLLLTPSLLLGMNLLIPGVNIASGIIVVTTFFMFVVGPVIRDLFEDGLRALPANYQNLRRRNLLRKQNRLLRLMTDRSVINWMKRPKSISRRSYERLRELLLSQGEVL